MSFLRCNALIKPERFFTKIFCWCNLLCLRDHLNLKDISHLEIKYKFPYCVVPYWNSIYNRGHTRLQDIFEVSYVFLMTEIWFQPIETKTLYNICTSSIFPSNFSVLLHVISGQNASTINNHKWIMRNNSTFEKLAKLSHVPDHLNVSIYNAF